MDVRAGVSQFVRADPTTVMELTAYENIPRWARKFRRLEVTRRDGNTVQARLRTRVMGIPLTADVTGVWQDDRVVEEIRISDGTVTHEQVVYRRVPEGTMVEWTGHIVSTGRLTRFLGPVMGRFFQWGVARDFAMLARHAERTSFDRRYAGVPVDQAERLRRFRQTHRPRHVVVGGVDWEYLAGGQGPQTLVILPGGLRTGEAAFHLILALEGEYRIIAPTYPAAPRMEQWVDGVKAILDAEGVATAHLFGSSAGGMVAQCFVRKYPDAVASLILGDTSLPDRVRGARYLRTRRLLPFVPLGLVRVLGRRRIPPPAWSRPSRPTSAPSGRPTSARSWNGSSTGGG